MLKLKNYSVSTTGLTGAELNRAMRAWKNAQVLLKHAKVYKMTF